MSNNPVEETLSASVQDYLKAIYVQTCNGQPTRTMELATALNIRPASVTNMLQKLADTRPDLVVYQKHRGVILTPKGKKAALRVIRQHRLIEQFLYQILEYPLDKIHEEADRLEHAVSPYFTERLARLLQHPNFDPHGDPIPDHNLNLNDPRTLASLSDLNPGEKGIVRQISNQDSDLLIYLKTIGVYPGAGLKVIQLNPIDGTQQVEIIDNGQVQVFGKTTSERIRMEVDQT